MRKIPGISNEYEIGEIVINDLGQVMFTDSDTWSLSQSGRVRHKGSGQATALNERGQVAIAEITCSFEWGGSYLGQGQDHPAAPASRRRGRSCTGATGLKRQSQRPLRQLRVPPVGSATALGDPLT